MRWFKKRSVPFDDNFTIVIEKPPDYSGTQELRFTVPYDYHAQIISVNLTVSGPAIGALRTNYLILNVNRGGDLLYAVASESYMAGGSLTVSATFSIGVTNSSPSVTRLFWMVPLPSQCFLYPHDLLRVFIPHFGDVFTLTNLIVVMKQWKTD